MFTVLHSKKLVKFVRAVLLLAVTGLIMRGVSVYFNVYLTSKLGSEGMGLYTLICSVYNFAFTFATSAINLASTRLVSEALGKGNHRGVRSAMARCIGYSLFFGTTALLGLFFLAPLIGSSLLKDSRTILSLRFFALSLPFIALSSCLNGYFTAVRRVSKNAAVQFAEQGVRVGLCVFLLSFFMPSDLEHACLCVVIGGCTADILSFIYSFIMFRYDLKKHVSRAGQADPDCKKQLLSIALPVALSSYLRSGLITLEHLLIPRGMRKMGMSNESALKIYGVMQGMALPVVMFPYALLSPFGALLIPEIAERRAGSDSKGIKRVSESAIGFVLIFGIGIAGIMAFFSNDLGAVFCKSPEASKYIRCLAPLLPIMYLDTITDCILKGLDHQLYTMRINIIDSFLSVIIVFFLVPEMGIYGYIAEIVVCELINASLSVWKLLSVVKFKMRTISRVLLPLVSIVLATGITRLFFNFFVLGAPAGAPDLIVRICLTLGIYLVLLQIFYLCFTGESLIPLKKTRAKQRQGT